MKDRAVRASRLVALVAVSAVIAVAVASCAKGVSGSESESAERPTQAEAVDGQQLAAALARGVYGSSSVEFSSLAEFVTGTDLAVEGRLVGVEPGYTLPDDDIDQDGPNTSFMYLVIEPMRVLSGDPSLATDLLRVDVPVPVNESADSLDALVREANVAVVAILFSAQRFIEDAPDGYFALPSDSMLVLGDSPDEHAWQLGGDAVEDELSLDEFASLVRELDAN